MELAIDKLKDELERNIELAKVNLDSDSIIEWRNLPVTKLFLLSMQHTLVDTNNSIAEHQPFNTEGTIRQATERGFSDCLEQVIIWNPIESDEEKS